MKLPELEPQGVHRAHPEIGIGVVGAGGIVAGAHLPAYAAAGFTVVALASRNAETLQRVGAEFGIERRVLDYRELLRDPRVAVVDIAIPGEGRLEVVRDAAAAGKHMLVQKPLANTLEEAEAMVRLARAAGVKLAVNQNARWAPVYRTAWWLIRQGFVGTVYDITHDMRSSQDAQPWFRERWYAREARFQIVQYSIHHLDLMRYWMGREPVAVLAHSSRRPGQAARGEMSADIILDFGPEATAVVRDRNACFAEGEASTTFVIEGTDGVLEGDVTRGTLRARHVDWGREAWDVPLEGSWFPGAFARTMGDLLDAVADGAEPSVNGEEHLRSLRLVEGAYASIACGGGVRV